MRSWGLRGSLEIPGVSYSPIQRAGYGACNERRTGKGSRNWSILTSNGVATEEKRERVDDGCFGRWRRDGPVAVGHFEFVERVGGRHLVWVL